MFKVFIPFRRYQEGLGGPLTFMRNLKCCLDKRGFVYQNKPWFAKSIFFPISCSIKTLKYIKIWNGKIIQRLDGVYYPSKHSDKYLEFNREMKDIYLNYTDYAIFQSEYSRKQVFEMFGTMPSDRYSIIPNGADLNIFYPSDNQATIPTRFITTGNFRNIDMIGPIVESLDLLQAAGKAFSLDIVGPISLKEKKSILSRSYVRNYETLDQPTLANSLRNSDIFLYTHLNPPCPNSVIEAISCGLPIVGYDSGSMSELCFFNSELLAYVSDDVFQVYEDFRIDALYEKIVLSIDNFETFKARSLKFAKRYSMERCADSYIEVFNNA